MTLRIIVLTVPMRPLKAPYITINAILGSTTPTTLIRTHNTFVPLIRAKLKTIKLLLTTIHASRTSFTITHTIACFIRTKLIQPRPLTQTTYIAMRTSAIISSDALMIFSRRLSFPILTANVVSLTPLLNVLLIPLSRINLTFPITPPLKFVVARSPNLLLISVVQALPSQPLVQIFAATRQVLTLTAPIHQLP